MQVARFSRERPQLLQTSIDRFQTGAFTAAELTNLRLVTWEEFQGDLEEAWLEHCLLPLINERLAVLIRYTEPLVPRSFTEVDDAGVERIKGLLARHDEFGWFVTHFTPIGVGVYGKLPRLPLRDAFPELGANVPAAVLDATGYREFAEAAIEHGEDAIEEFQDALRAGGVEVPKHNDRPETRSANWRAASRPRARAARARPPRRPRSREH